MISFTHKNFFKNTPEKQSDPENQTEIPESIQTPTPPENPPTPAIQENPSNPSIPGCNHSLGYLNKRAKGEEMPSECIVCSQSIECLLGSLKTQD